MNSGDSKCGDKKQVVGYWSIAVTRDSAKSFSQQPFNFTPEDKIMLLGMARKTIEKYVKDRRIPDDHPADYPSSLKLLAGAFVTLKEEGSLRGCIGRFTSGIPLYKLVREMAIASATEDTRFEPVTSEEVRSLEIEISVLSPLTKITSPAEIILGKHGIYIKKGHSSGTFLPQVATDTGWDVESFLGHCARDKAGIGWSGWKDAELYIYEACVFSESDFSVRKD